MYRDTYRCVHVLGQHLSDVAKLITVYMYYLTHYRTHCGSSVRVKLLYMYVSSTQ